MEREVAFGKAVCSLTSSTHIKYCVIQAPQVSWQDSQPESFCCCTCTHVCGQWTHSSSYHLLLVPDLLELTMAKAKLTSSALSGLTFIPGQSPRAVLISPAREDSKYSGVPGWEAWRQLCASSDTQPGTETKGMQAMNTNQHVRAFKGAAFLCPAIHVDGKRNESVKLMFCCTAFPQIATSRLS